MNNQPHTGISMNKNIGRKPFPRKMKPTFLLKWRMENFKSVRTAEISLAPLTVLVGPNSAGKSSLLQSILLFAQNAQRNGRVIDTQARGQLIFNGDLVSLGSISEALNSNSKNGQDYLEFGGTFSLGQEFFRPLLGRQNRIQGDELIWNVKLSSIDNDNYSGLANVSESKVELMRKGECLERISSDQTDGKHILGENFQRNPRFSYDHKATVIEFSDEKPVKSDVTEEYAAVSFASGLPIEGLIQKPRLDIMLAAVKIDFMEILRGYSTFDNILKLRIARDDQEELFAAYKNVDDAIEQAVVAFEQVFLKQVQSEEIDGILTPSRIAARRASARQIVDFGAVPWKTIMDQMKKLGVTEIQLLDFSENEEALDSKLESALESEINAFLEKFEREVRARFSLTPEAMSMEFEERLRGIQRGRQVGSLVFEAVDNWNTYLTEKIRYLEPLREVPKAFYTYASGGGINPQIPLGSRGEHLAQALYDKTPRVYPLPDKLDNKKMISLIDAVNKWLPFLDLEGQIEVVPQGRQGFYLTVGNHVLPMLGTGISQILPVLTLCLTARRGDLVLLEQPELHLNPSIQQKLAEFLLAMSRVDRQIIVETHSEYFVTRLRLLQARDEKMGQFIKLLFVEKTKDLGTSYREVATNTFGEIQEWPKGFFDQASNDLRELMKVIAERKIEAKEKGVNTSDA
jgi:predicted ATPase